MTRTITIYVTPNDIAACAGGQLLAGWNPVAVACWRELSAGMWPTRPWPPLTPRVWPGRLEFFKAEHPQHGHFSEDGMLVAAAWDEPSERYVSQMFAGQPIGPAMLTAVIQEPAAS